MFQFQNSGIQVYSIVTSNKVKRKIFSRELRINYKFQLSKISEFIINKDDKNYWGFNSVQFKNKRFKTTIFEIISDEKQLGKSNLP